MHILLLFVPKTGGIIFVGGNTFNQQSNPESKGGDTNSSVVTFGPQSKNLASIVRGVKSAVTIHAKIAGQDFAWQERFHDHVIRNEEEYRNIRNYIANNPANWEKDKFY